MASINREICPTCGQTINSHTVSLDRSMVNALMRVFKWCQENNRHEFKRKDIKHLFKNETESAHFGNWILFGGLVYRPDGKGTYGLNMYRCFRFFKGELTIPTAVLKDKVNKRLIPSRFRAIKEVPELSAFLDQNGEYISQYGDPKRRIL